MQRQSKKLLGRGLSSLALLLATPVFAAMSVPEGWYIEGNAGSTNLSEKSYPGSSSSSGIGGNVNLGYKFMPYLGAEVGYTLYANTSIKDGNGTKAATDRHYSYDLAGKGILPIGASGAEVFAKLGIQRINSSVSINNDTAASNIGISSSSHSDTSLYLGIGGQYYFTPELAGVVQWAQAQGNSSTGTLSLLSLGLSFIID